MRERWRGMSVFQRLGALATLLVGLGAVGVLYAGGMASGPAPTPTPTPSPPPTPAPTPEPTPIGDRDAYLACSDFRELVRKTQGEERVTDREIREWLRRIRDLASESRVKELDEGARAMVAAAREGNPDALGEATAAFARMCLEVAPL